MSGPFSNGTDGELFTANRCDRCTRRAEIDDGPCEEFTPAYFDEMPEILFRVPRSAANPVGVECRLFDPEDDAAPPPAPVSAPPQPRSRLIIPEGVELLSYDD